MTTFVNLTPHVINVIGEGGTTVIPTAGTVARVSVNYTTLRVEGGAEMLRPEFGEVLDLPEPQEGVIYIVSGMVRSAVPDRLDVVSPGPLVRDEQGRPIGCEGLATNE